MQHRMRIALALAAAGLAGGGAVAVAQGGDADPDAEREAFLEDAAGRLGVEPEELERALEEAAVARVDAAVDAGRLTEEQAAELKERIRAGGAGLLPGVGLRGGPPGPGGFEHRGFEHGPGLLEPAADYLGLPQDELRNRLSDGDSLAEIAEGEGKDVDGLVDALVATVRERLDEALAAGRLDEDGVEKMADAIRERIEALVRRELRLPDRGRGAWDGA